VYTAGYELANGYLELRDVNEQLERFMHIQKTKNQSLPIDTHFIQALKKGLPPCCGVAVGFDRLLMLMLQTEKIQDVIPIAWAES
jgi:lysyl-tRNA synthetase class 2